MMISDAEVLSEHIKSLHEAFSLYVEVFDLERRSLISKIQLRQHAIESKLSTVLISLQISFII
jgi:hypothetical protein